MAHPKETRDKVYRLYVFEQQSLEIAALMAQVPFATARRWKDADKTKGRDWEKMRAANQMAGGGLEEVGRTILAGFLIQYRSTFDQLSVDQAMPAPKKVALLASLADAFNKTVAASRKVLPETSQLATALEVLNLLSVFLQQKYPQHLAAFLEILEPFGEEVQQKYG